MGCRAVGGRAWATRVRARRRRLGRRSAASPPRRHARHGPPRPFRGGAGSRTAKGAKGRQEGAKGRKSRLPRPRPLCPFVVFADCPQPGSLRRSAAGASEPGAMREASPPRRHARHGPPRLFQDGAGSTTAKGAKGRQEGAKGPRRGIPSGLRPRCPLVPSWFLLAARTRIFRVGRPRGRPALVPCARHHRHGRHGPPRLFQAGAGRHRQGRARARRGRQGPTKGVPFFARPAFGTTRGGAWRGGIRVRNGLGAKSRVRQP